MRQARLLIHSPNIFTLARLELKSPDLEFFREDEQRLFHPDTTTATLCVQLFGLFIFFLPTASSPYFRCLDDLVRRLSHLLLLLPRKVLQSVRVKTENYIIIAGLHGTPEDFLWGRQKAINRVRWWL